MTTTLHHQQRGITLVEALIGLLMLSVGLLGALRLQSWLRLHGDIAHQRTDAVQLAQQDLEHLRGFAHTTAFGEIASLGSTAHGANATAFTLARTVSPSAGLKSSHVSVRWRDRSDSEQAIELHTSIAAVAPIYSAALALPPQDRSLAPRSHLPVGARQISEGRSVLKPSAAGTVVWILDSATGMVVSRCSVPAGLTVRDITPAHLNACTDRAGLLVRGHIRFSLGPQPDAEHPNDAPLALSLVPGECEIDVVNGRERHLAYFCIVPPNGLGAEPLRIVPDGWVFGATATTFKACRYTEAPHNYLVVRGDGACPSELTPHNVASLATTQHQP
ncbi:MAG TPA: prepilin-type N-terminal cleavage/methylation domain-containing protein [Rhizobacter sp.]|nr:prepilin-type N-terminal cleavage/methylation domain-containing protein [Rhizobacter sp.]